MSEEYRRRGWWRDQTFLDDLRRHVRERPGKTAVATRRYADRPDREPDVRVLDYAELGELAEHCAGALVGLGVHPGDTVAVQLTDRWELPVLAMGCMRAGVRFCPLLSIYRRRELETMLGFTEAKVFVTDSVRDAAALAELRDGSPALSHVVVADGPAPEGTIDLHARLFDRTSAVLNTAELDARELGPDDPYLTLFTSGTTGEPKAVMHSANTLHAAVRGEAVTFGLDDSLVMSTTAAYTHYTGVAQGMLMPLMLGGSMAFQDLYEPGVELDMLAEFGVTFLYVAPHTLRQLVDVQRAEPRDLSALRRLVSGSAPIPPVYVTDVEQTLGLRLYSLWGMSENGPVTITRETDPHDWAAHSDGSPIADMEFRIDPVAEQPEGVGVLRVRGPTQCLGYDRRAELYAAKLDADGWFDTGDLARSDGRGGIRIVGRADDAIKSKAFVIPVTDIEAILDRHPKVREATVIGVPSTEGDDETICAVVTPVAAPGDDTPVTLDELRQALDDAGMMNLYWPRRIEVVDDLPKTPTGKVRKVWLKERFG